MRKEEGVSNSFAVILDSGAEAFYRRFTTRADAIAQLRRHNTLARQQKARGDLITLRIATCVVEIKHEAAMAENRKRLRAALSTRKKRKST